MRVWFLVLFVVLVSGCNGPRVTDGVKVNSFGFDSYTVSDKEQVELSLEIENVGAFDAEDVSFFLYGYDEDALNSLYVDASVGTASEDGWVIDVFRGYDMDAKAQGMSADYYQVFEMSDEISKGIAQKYNFNGRLCYYYETRANAKIKAISAAQKRDEKSKGKYSEGSVDVWNSYGPVQIEVKTKSPLVFYGSSGGQETEVALIIKDVAAGFPSSSGCALEIEVGDINELVSLDVSLDGAVLDCDDAYSFFDGEAVVYCTYDVGASRPKGEYMLSIVAGYYYYVDMKSSVSVVGSSDDVVVGTGRGRDGEVYKGGSCEDLCAAVGTQPDELSGLAMCTDGEGEDVGTYPGTDIEVYLVELSDAGDLVGDDSVYLEDLDVHHVTVGDINLRGLDVDTLDKAGISRQYTEETFEIDTDRDGLPDEWENLFIKINYKKKDTDEDGKDDGYETCLKDNDGCCGFEGKTYKELYNDGCQSEAYLDDLRLGLVEAVGKDTLGSKDVMIITSEDGEPHRMNDDKEFVDGMKIVSIDGKDIEDITGDHANSKVWSIKYIDVEMLDLSKMSVEDFDDIFKKVKCENEDTYDEETTCKCVTEVGGEGPPPYPKFGGTSASRCDTRCDNLGYDGGICIGVSKDTYNDDDWHKGLRCDGSTVVQYKMDISNADDERDADDKEVRYDCGSEFCWCYYKIRTLNTLEKRLLCE